MNYNANGHYLSGTEIYLDKQGKTLYVPVNPLGMPEVKSNPYFRDLELNCIFTVTGDQAFLNAGGVTNGMVLLYDNRGDMCTPVAPLDLEDFQVRDNGVTNTYTGKKLLSIDTASDPELPFAIAKFDSFSAPTKQQRVYDSVLGWSASAFAFYKRIKPFSVVSGGITYYRVLFFPGSSDSTTITLTMSLANYSGEITLTDILNKIISENPGIRNLCYQSGYYRVRNAEAAIIRALFPKMKILNGAYDYQSSIVNSITEAGTYRVVKDAVAQEGQSGVTSEPFMAFGYTANATPSQEIYRLHGGVPGITIGRITVTS